jgi:ATP phosphoribosyltransferase
VNTEIAAPPLTLLLPKNGGLAAMTRRALETLPLPDRIERTSVRGEDVPLLANELAGAGRPVLAFTGQDLLQEWIARGNALGARLRRTSVAWDDPSARYGKPALCLIGRRGAALPARGRIRVAICAKYAALARTYLATLAQPGRSFEPIAISGSVEAALVHGLADVMIDIVLSGTTIDALELDVYDVIFRSDLALLEANR